LVLKFTERIVPTDLALFSAYAGLPFSEQVLHGLHFMLCSFAVLIGCTSLAIAKGTGEYKFGGLLYLPVSLAALMLASFMAWREASFVLFCFDAFCAYLLLSGWRAVHERDKPKPIDWTIPAGLFLLSGAVALHAFFYDEGTRGLYLWGFALNGFYLSWRDAKHLNRRAYWNRNKAFLTDASFGEAPAWLGRHIAGMAGSMMANLSVVVLTLLPLELHWLWPTALMLAGAYIAWRERQKKMRVRRVLAPILHPDFARRKKTGDTPNIRRAA
jgi:hypothetical protein